MSRDVKQSRIANDVFEHDDQQQQDTFSSCCKAANEESTTASSAPTEAPCRTSLEDSQSQSAQMTIAYLQSRRGSFSEELWEDALRRHCDSRQNVRNLLDRYIKPH
jgi:hypothetical protein